MKKEIVYLRDIACCIAEDMETTGYAQSADEVLCELEYRFAQNNYFGDCSAQTLPS